MFIALFFTFCAASAQNMSVQQYIETYKEMAIREMKRMGVPASITLAQGILETESGNSELVKKSNNHFGIKCKSTWNGNSVFHDDDEKGECFRKYNTAEESYRDHSNFLRGSERYAFLFSLNPSDYKGWAYGLKKAGYATNPKYPDMLIKSIETYNLNQYTLSALGEIPDFNQVEVDIPVQTEVTHGPGEETPAVPVDAGRTRFNGLKAVFAPAGTSLLAIATRYEISLARLLEFNDLKSDGLLAEESWIFLEKKLKQSNRDYYTTQGTENVYDIAQNNALQLSYLLKYNGLNEGELVKAGTRIWLKPQEIVQPVPANPKLKYHEVKPKEGLYTISKMYNVSVSDLKDWNELTSDNLRVGQKLIVSK